MKKAFRRRFIKFGLIYFISLFFLLFLNICYTYAGNTIGIAGDAEAYRTKGYEAQQRGDIDIAIEWYQKAASIKPGYASPHNDLGILFETKGWLDKAEAEYENALAIDPNYKEVHTNLALLYERKGELEKAAFHWMRRYKLGSPDDPWTQKAKDKLEKFDLLDNTKNAGSKIEQKVVRKPIKKKTKPEPNAKKGSKWEKIGPEKKVEEGLKPPPTKSKKTLDAELQESLKLAEERLRKERNSKENTVNIKEKQANIKAVNYNETNLSYNKAKDYYNKGEYSNALDTIRLAKQSFPENKSLLELEEEIRFKMKEERIEDYCKEGMRHYRQKNFAGARKEFEAILNILPE